MKKGLIIGSIVAVALIAFGVAGFAYAQSQTPPTPGYPFGNGMMGGRGGMMGRGNLGTYGPMHDHMVKAMAEALDVTPEDLQARLDKGETMWTIAQEKGLTQDEFIELMTEARTKALEQAVADGVITQAQADWMLSHMGGNGGCMGGGFGSGRGGGRWNEQPAPSGLGG